MDLAVDAALDDRTEIGHLGGGLVEVGLGTAVEADADDGFLARAIAAVIDLDHNLGSNGDADVLARLGQGDGLL